MLRTISLVVLLCVCINANAGTPGTAAWFASNWFKQQDNKKTTDNDDGVIWPVGMEEFVKACTELSSDVNFCKKTWIDARMAGTEIILVPVDRYVEVKTKIKNDTVKNTKSEVKKITKYVAESKVKSVNLLDVDNKEYKSHRDAVMTHPNAVVLHQTIR